MVELRLKLVVGNGVAFFGFVVSMKQLIHDIHDAIVPGRNNATMSV